MPSPLPGMDPYLEAEKLWPAFHHLAMAGLYQDVLRNLTDRYRVRLGQRRYATEMPLFTSVIREEHCEEVLEIREKGSGRLVTVLDLPGPFNKGTAAGRTAYLDHASSCRNLRGNFVEIDLTLGGTPLNDISRDHLPEKDYLIVLNRSTAPDRYEIGAMSLRKRLPRFKLPLAADDRDLVLDLQLIITRAYDQGNLAASIDYERDPPVALSDADKKWLHETLVAARLRK